MKPRKYDHHQIQAIYLELRQSFHDWIRKEYYLRTGQEISRDALEDLFEARMVGRGCRPGRRPIKVSWPHAVGLLLEDPWLLLYPKQFAEKYNAGNDEYVNEEALRRWLRNYSVRIARRSPHYEPELEDALRASRFTAYTIPPNEEEP